VQVLAKLAEISTNFPFGTLLTVPAPAVATSSPVSRKALCPDRPHLRVELQLLEAVLVPLEQERAVATSSLV
jgi:hypothetical protein